jgi:hypothetical protein
MDEFNWGSPCDECGEGLEEIKDFDGGLQHGGCNDINSLIWFLLKKVYWTGYEQGCHDAPFCCRKKF